MHDFRSDLMSGAPEGVNGLILEALKAAPAFGHREDPFQVRLERQVAEMLGFEDALLVPTCTIANQIALRIWSERGHSHVVSDAHCHLVVAEAASTQILNDVKLEALYGERGHLSAQQVDQHLSAAESAPLIWLENTHMAHGGTVMPTGWLADISKVAGARQAPIHLDGSRIWNAIVKSGVASDQVALGTDSLSLSLTKALGAPAGSMILGSREFVRRAVEIRSAFGASWRPIGVVSAAALQVLPGFERRLERDHRRTQALASMLTGAFAASGSSFAINAPDTNILLLQTPDTAEADALHQFLMERQLMSLRFGASAIRFVVHARTEDDSIAALATSVAEFITSKSKVKA